jgi:hemolysin III
MAKYITTYYPAKEEILNVISHFLGLLLSIAALALMVTFASLYGTAWHIVSFSIFGSSLVVLYLASTLYHAARKRKVREKLNVFDHAAIYVLIAGTYTPFTLVTLNGAMGWVLFGITWGLAVTGVILKLFYTGRFEKLSTASYILMGWVAVIAVQPLIEALSGGGLFYLVAGGICYTIGALFYSINKLPYNHAIFHVWVLAGSIFHFVSIFFYVL